MIKVMGRQFTTKQAAIHWIEVGIRLTNNPESKARLHQELRKLKGKGK